MVYKIFAYSLYCNKEKGLLEIKENKTIGMNMPELYELTG